MVKLIESLFTFAGKARDGFISIGAVLYGSGYLIWALHARKESLGALPVLGFGYIFSGLPIVIIFLLAYAIIEKGHIVQSWLSKKYPKIMAHSTGIVLAFALIFLVMILTDILFIDSRKNFNLPFLSVIFLMQFPLLLILSIVISEDSKIRTFLIGSGWLISIISTFIVMSRYVMPLLPQEFGGFEPRYGIIELNKETISLPRKVYRAEIHYYDNNIVIFKKYEGPKKKSSTYQISQSRISSIKWD